MRRIWFGGTLALVVAGGLGALVACYPGTVTNIEQLDVVVTLHNDTVTFTGRSTLAVIDSVIHLTDPDNPADTLTVSRDFDDLVISTVISNYESFGYDVVLVSPDQTEFPPEDRPDWVVFLSATATENWFAYLTYPWWGYWGWWGGWGWWPGYGPGWGWWYPCCGSIGTGSYTTGTLFIDQIDPNNPDLDEERLPSDWVAGLNGVLGGTSANTANRLTNGINQAFDQSQYLRQTPGSN